MKYILSGDDKAVKNLIQESRLLIERGLVSIEPMPEADSKDAAIADSKDAPEADSKKPKKK